MLPPGCIILEEKPFFYYDHRKANDRKSMNEGHYHNFSELYYLVSGSCDYLIDNAVYSLKPNGLVFIPANIIHKTVYTSKNHERIVLNFTSDFIDPILIPCLSDVFLCNLNNAKDIEYMDKIFYGISKNVYKDDPVSQLILRCCNTELLAYISQHYSSTPDTSIIEDTPLDRALTYISENYSQNISLKQLSDMSGYNKDYFSKLFKKTVGTGCKEYILLTRLSASEQLLTTTNKSIREIAISCGFNDSNHFSSTFKKFYGTSPLKYKHLKNLGT